MERQVVESLKHVCSSWESDASFSSCRKYRWWLTRYLGVRSKKLVFIGLNPSGANETQEDPTLRRLMNFARSWSYGQIIVLNLFGRISKSPSTLRKTSNPIGKFNNNLLKVCLFKWSRNSNFDLWLGWGAGGTFRNQNLFLINYLSCVKDYRLDRFPFSYGALSLGQTKAGHPRHPLYLSNKELLNPYNYSEI